eukprot:2849594-Amphidinium_carterae.1
MTRTAPTATPPVVTMSRKAEECHLDSKPQPRKSRKAGRKDKQDGKEKSKENDEDVPNQLANQGDEEDPIDATFVSWPTSQIQELGAWVE